MDSRIYSAIAEHTTYLLTRARAFTRNEADAHDLVQDTCLNALEALAKAERPPENLRGWLIVVMRNRWFNVVRDSRAHALVHLQIAASDPHDAGLFETRAVYRQVERAWSQLSEQARTIAYQCLLDGESHEDVSRRFGITPGGVATSIHRTRQTLREAMFGA
jgi:RNA polymerase sigma factor (sigma-70 family)